MAKIVGDTTATPNGVPDWNQNDPNKADYIKNKPALAKDNDSGVVQTGCNAGRENEAANASAAFGCWNRIRKFYSLAAGWGNQIDAEKSAAFGAYNLLTGNANIANGRCNEAKGYAGAALGQDNVSIADNAMCFGESLIATVPGQVVVGRNNAPNDDAIFIVGNGDIHRQNAFAVLKDGRITLGGAFEESRVNFYAKRIWNTLSLAEGQNISLSSGGTISRTSSQTLEVVSTTNAGGTRPQTTVRGGNYGLGNEYVMVEKGKNYTFSFQVKNPNCRVRYWLCATDNTNVGFTATAQKNACVIFETGMQNEIPTSNAWKKVTVEITDCPYSGYLRLGICSTDVAMATFEIYGIQLHQNAPVYNYVSKDGAYKTTLYKIAELQSVADKVYDWLLEDVSIMYGNTAFPERITEENIDDKQAYKDDQENAVAVKNNKVMLACVNRIVPDKMDVKERGVYVDESVYTLYYQKFTDKVAN